MNRRIIIPGGNGVACKPKGNAHHSTELAGLSDRERQALSRCESVIERHLKAFYEAGKALLEIRDNLLYRAEFATFEEYCRNRWSISRVHAHRLLKATEVIDAVLLPMGNISMPGNEHQVRPLVGKDPEDARSAWSEAAEQANGKKITGKMVSDALKRQTASPKSRNCRESWQDRIETLLLEALRFTREGDKPAVEEILFKVQLEMEIGRHSHVTEM